MLLELSLQPDFEIRWRSSPEALRPFDQPQHTGSIKVRKTQRVQLGRTRKSIQVEMQHFPGRQGICFEQAVGRAAHRTATTEGMHQTSNQRRFSGAEIAELVPAAMFTAFADGCRPLTTADLVNAARATVPVSRSAAERIGRLREWARTRARPAALPEAPPQPQPAPTRPAGGRSLGVELEER